MSVRSRFAGLVVLLGALAAMPATAQAETVTATQSVAQSCVDRPLPAGPGVAARTVSAPRLGLLQARLSAPSGDWDLGVFDAASGAAVAGSAYRGSRELAEGIVSTNERLVVQACRRSGSAAVANLTLSWLPVTPTQVGPDSLVRVNTPSPGAKTSLLGLDLDLTEHGRAGFVDVVLHGPADAARLSAAGLSHQTVVSDLAAVDRANRSADRAYAASVQRSSLPSGRTTYRRLFDYSEEMKALAAQNPGIVRGFTLPNLTYEGRPVEGIEISENVNASDGKPVFLNMGVHHAREWPSGEHAMEWAHELVNGYSAGDARVRGLMASTRTIVIPIVNPDGFNISREAGELQGGGAGRGGDDTQETINIVSHPFEYRRKNCRFLDDSDGGSCLQPSFGLAEPGVDPNRNYGGFWGGPGASTDPTAQDYRGPAPFSEPETQNIRGLVSARQVTGLITNHTYSNLVLRPPGIQAQGDAFDEPIYKALGDAMAAENGYASQQGWQLYDTTGTTEDWTYFATGGLGFTFEIGPTNFHPPFADVVAEYEGTTPVAPGGGNREAYYLASESAADPAKHSLLRGTAPAGATLRLHKSFETPTTAETPGHVDDTLDTTLTVPASGEFVWHVNPSTRPLVAEASGREPTGDPSPRQSFSGAPGPSALPCANADSEDEGCFNDHPFTVPAGPGIDNAKANVGITWTTPVSDWDMKVFRDSNGDGSSVGETEAVGVSAQGTTSAEDVTVSEPLLTPGAYVVRVVNFAAAEPYQGTVSFAGPDALVPAQVESWTLTCEVGGEVVTAQQVTIGRGEEQVLDLSSCTR
jgi:Zinc carboxypeptidase